MVKRSFYVFTLLSVIALLLQGAYSTKSQAASTVTLDGSFLVVWGDGTQGSNTTAINYYLATKAYDTVKLLVSNDLLAASGGMVGLNRKVVQVSGVWHEIGKSLIAETIIPAAGQVLKPDGVYGPQPWVSILCKFADIPDEPNGLDFFKQMYSSQYPGLDHFWRQNSYELANLLGSDAYGWYTLPHERAYYLDGSGNWDFGKSAIDCTGVADQDVDFSPFVGINLMFNANLDCCAWGGSWYSCLDGICQNWRMTWEPPWGYQNIGVIAHETGHGFGLPHSLGNCQQGYDNRWDVLSDVWSNGTDPIFPQFGTMGQHTIAYHKEMLEWITADQQYTAMTGTSKTITLERQALPHTDNYLEARILVDNRADYFYTLEVRQPTQNPIDYDKWLPGFAVIIHEVDQGRPEPAVVIDQDGDCNTADDGAMYKVGETFLDAANGVSVSIDAVTQTGYTVTIKNRYTAMEGVTLTGDDIGFVGESIPFTATVTPLDATTPITYTWQANGQDPIVHVGETDDKVEFTWDDLGTKLITVTASNAGGSVVDTHSITMGSLFPVVRLSGPEETTVDTEIKLTATSLPSDVAQPVTYTWTVEGVPAPITHTGGLSDSVNVVWGYPGVMGITVTAENIHGSSTDSFSVHVRMAPVSLEVSGVYEGRAGIDYSFTAAVSPIDTTVPITYVWTVDGGDVITHTSGITDTLVVSWKTAGLHRLSVLASNPAGSTAAEWSVTIYFDIYIPLGMKN